MTGPVEIRTGLIARETGVQRAIVVALERSGADWEESLEELISLADTAGA